MKFFKRPMLPVLLMFMGGLVAGRALWPFPWWATLLVGLFGLIIAVGMTIRGRDTSALLLFLAICMGAARIAPLMAEREVAENLARTLDPVRPMLMEGRVEASAGEGDSGPKSITLRDVVVTGSVPRRIPGRVRLSVNSRTTSSPIREFYAGETIRAFGQLGRPQSFSNFGTPDFREYLAMDRVYFTARVHSAQLIQRISRGLQAAAKLYAGLAAARQFATDFLLGHMPDHEGRLIVSMFFNDRKLLSPEDQEVFRNSGTMHLFAVSGLHIAMFAGLLLLLLRACRVPIRSSWVVIVVVLLLYVTMLDFIPPAARSLWMALAYASGLWLKREVDTISAPAFGVFVILVMEPLALWQASFLLSAGGVVGIVVFVPLFTKWLSPLPDEPGFFQKSWRWVYEAFAVSIAVTLVLLPLQLLLFQQFNVLTPVINIFAAALSGVALGGAIATVAFGAAIPILAAPMGAATGMIMTAIFEISRIGSDQTWAMVYCARPPYWAIGAYYLILGSGYYMVHRDTPEFPKKSRARLVVHMLAAVLVLVVSAVVGAMNCTLRIYFLDVGQGDSTLVRFPTGQTLLVDAGNVLPDLGKLVVRPQLSALGVRPLGQLVATHDDADHIGGMPTLLRSHPVASFMAGGKKEGKSALLSEIETVIAGKKIPSSTATTSSVVQLDDHTTIEILNPGWSADGDSVRDNDRSIVLRISHGGFTALLMADAERSVEERLIREGIGRCDVLKVGHHGSRTSSTERFIAETSPTVSIISCGYRNNFGHPHREVLRRLEGVGSTVYRTDVSGAILVKSDGKNYTVTTAR
ncbi:MAG: DNA internalization-related competence protein ComEC/Rec2 [Candidatus Sumerlaeaceae bacterium]|nr:DNA internalization-related competence protein ComEC/Rec2 [Candidatus Sumerlaeaceae bacterium]